MIPSNKRNINHAAPKTMGILLAAGLLATIFSAHTVFATTNNAATGDNKSTELVNSPPKTRVDPKYPTRNKNEITITKQQGINYSKDGKPIVFNKDGEYIFSVDPGKEVTVIMTPDETHKFFDDNPEVLRFIGRVEPGTPVIEGETLVVNEQEGVNYTLGGQALTFKDGKAILTINGPEEITIVAKPSKDTKFEDGYTAYGYDYVNRNNTIIATGGYIFSDDGAASWRGAKDVTPAAPVRKGNKVTIAKTPGVTYKADDKEIKPNIDGEISLSLKPNKETTITATADKYYSFEPITAPKEWKFTGEKEQATPKEPIRDGNKLTIIAALGVNYTINGEKVDFKDGGETTFTIGDGEELLVAATPADEDYKFEGDDQFKDWKFTWVAPADTKQSNEPKPALVDDKQSRRQAPADTKQSGTPKPALIDYKQSDAPKPSPVDVKQSDRPTTTPTVVKPAERDNTQSKRPTVISKTTDKEQSRTDGKQSGKSSASKQSSVVKKKTLADTGATGVTIASSIAALLALAGGVILAVRIRM